MEWDEAESTQLIQGFEFDGGDRILIADANPAVGDWLRVALGGDVRVERSDNSRRVFERLTADPPRILVVGANLLDVSGSVLLSHAARYNIIGPHHGPVVFLIGTSNLDMPQVDENVVRVFFRITPELPQPRVKELFQIALARQDQPQAPAAPQEDPARTRLVVEHAKRFSMLTEIEAAAVAVEIAVREVCRADRARVRYFDDEGDSLWRETKEGIDSSPASAGLAGYVVRAGVPLVLEVASMDPGYRAAVDDPAGTGQERLAIMPVRDRDQKIHAVLIAIREPTSSPFTVEDERLLRGLAEAWGPFIHQLAANQAAEEQRGDSIFRSEAINHLARRGNEGDVVHVNPAWVSAAYWVMLLAVIAGGAFSYFVEIHQYSEGQAVIRATGRAEAVTYDGGTVTGIEVSEGQQVEKDQVLVRLHDIEQAAKLRALRAEQERKLVAYLQNNTDPAARSALGQATSDLDTATAGVDARVIRAQAAGTIRDVHVRVGQRVEAGAVVATIARADEPEGLSIIAFLPGGDRPRLRAHQRLRVNLTGYRGAHFETEVHAISNEVLGAKEAATRFLGDRLADSLQVPGTVVVVEGTLPFSRFEHDGQSLDLHDGMLGSVAVELESKSVLATIFPGLDL